MVQIGHWFLLLDVDSLKCTVSSLYPCGNGSLLRKK